MGISNVTENNLLNLVFSAQAWSGYADNTVTTPETHIDVALHTGDPGDTGDMSTNEVSYTGYTRVGVARSNGWTIATEGSISPAMQIDFPTGTGGGGEITYFSTGKTGGGPTPILWTGSVTPSMQSGADVSPHLTLATTISLD